MPTFHELSTSQLRQALQLREQIETMQEKLNALLGGGGSTAAPAPKAKDAVGRPRGKRTMSPDARAKIAAAARARWAKVKGKSAAPAKSAPAKATPAKAAAKPAPAKAAAKSAPKKTGGLTPEGRAKLAAAMKARWEARKKSAPAPTAKKES